MESTNRKCAELYNVTKSNIDKMLKSVDSYLEQNLQIVRQNRSELEIAINKIQNETFISSDDDKR